MSDHPIMTGVWLVCADAEDQGHMVAVLLLSLSCFIRLFFFCY